MIRNAKEAVGGESLVAEKNDDDIKTTETAAGTIDVKKVVRRGRPVTKPASKAVIFHLSLELIAKIDQAAAEKTLGNKSALATMIFSEYFASDRPN